MKSSKNVRVWRPFVGVAVVGALALGVSALAGPRAGDEAVRGTVKTGTEVTRLVTGDPAQINAVVAGVGTTAVLEILPVPVPTTPGPVPPYAYPAGCSIVGNEFRCDMANKDGFRLWLKVFISNWDPLKDNIVQGTCSAAPNASCPASTDPNCCTTGLVGAVCTTNDECDTGLKAYQVKIDCVGGVNKGYMDSDCPGDQPDLANPVIACPAGAAGNTLCREAFGESWAKCETGFCKPGYLDFLGTGAPVNAWCEADGGGCSAGDVATGTCNYNYFSVADSATGRPETLAAGTKYDGGTLVLDIPPLAKGRYVVNLNTDETFLADTQVPPADIATLRETGFAVNLVTGSCCFGLGTAGAGCIDSCVNRSDCNAQPGPRVFTPGAVCADGCVECTIEGVDPLCDDGDACTTESCNATLGICNRANVSGWDTGTECCDPATGTITGKDDGNPCTDDACSLDPTSGTPKPGNGIPTHSPASSSTPCNDNNPCSIGDHCIGSPGTSCTGTDVNTLPCVTSADCPLDPAGSNYACVDSLCFCTLTPTVTFEIPVGERKTCDGGPRDGLPCTSTADCVPFGVCDNYADGANCFDEGEKITALVHIGASGAPVNGGQFLVNFDSSCLSFNSATCLSPYVTEVFRDVSSGSVFLACGVNAFAGADGPFGGTDIISLSFKMIGDCAECDLCFASTNPENTYLVDDEGQRISIDPRCKSVRANGTLVLDIPDNIKTNADCNGPTAVETWDAPSATFSCGTASLSCRGAHESGVDLSDLALGGGEFPSGSSSFCCSAVANYPCGTSAGCAGRVNDCPGTPKPDGCWTVEVNDETSLDIDVQLCPPMAASGELTRCIKFCLYSNCLEDPICFSDPVTFGGLYNFAGKSRGKVKIPGTAQWGCITAQDQLHTLRSCYTFAAGDCDDGQLHARFAGDHAFDGTCLLGGNLDGWKKAVPGSNPSLDVIDILDYGTFVSQFGTPCGDADTPCPALDHGPNADINGDGCVTIDDYQFVIANYLTSAKDCCCGPQAADLPPALTEVSIDELRQMGLEDLAVADLNGDGVLNADDMDAFVQGVRPSKSTDRKGGKGLRSGR